MGSGREFGKIKPDFKAATVELGIPESDFEQPVAAEDAVRRG